MNTFDTNNIQAVAIDLDGTLLDRGILYPAVTETLKQVAACGIHVIPATGRIRGLLPEALRAVPGLRYAVTLNGACVSDLQNNRHIARTPLEPALMKAIADFVAQAPIPPGAHFMTDDTVILAPTTMVRTRELHLRHFSPQSVAEFEKVCTLVDSPAAYIAAHNVTVDKLVFACPTPEYAVHLREQIDRDFDVETAIMEEENVEVTTSGISKASGLQALAAQLDFSLDRTMAIGDSGNDVRMLEAVGYPIAMGNAPPEIQALARQVAPPVEEMGVATILRELFLA